LRGGLGVGFLILFGVGQLRGRGIDHFDGAAVELAEKAGAPVSHLGGRVQGLFQSFARQALTGLHIGRIALIHQATAQQAPKSLDVAHDLTAGGAWVEHLPDEAFEGQSQAEDPLAAVRSLVGGREKRCGQEVAQVFLELDQGCLADSLGGAPAQGGQTRTEGWEIGSVFHGWKRWLIVIDSKYIYSLC
jgi:hypothetical protein